VQGRQSVGQSAQERNLSSLSAPRTHVGPASAGKASVVTPQCWWRTHRPLPG